MADTNVTAVFNATGCLEFRQGDMASNVSGPVLMRFNSTGNGVDLQVAKTALAGSNAANVNVALNFGFTVTDNTGTIYYIPAASAMW